LLTADRPLASAVGVSRTIERDLTSFSHRLVGFAR
jgi:hypothetical protein